MHGDTWKGSRLRLGSRVALSFTGALVLVVGCSHGCYTPPVILEGGRRELQLGDFPSGTEPVELTVAPDVALHGVFVPAGPGAPVALCFLESMGSISYGSRPILKIGAFGTPGANMQLSGFPQRESREPVLFQYVVLAQLRALGCSSLVVDYEGVGASGGERSPDNLRRDAQAAWDEAVRRAGGDAGRVILRGTSIGTLAVATLLEDGARPAAVTLVAPVRAETVALNFGRMRYGAVFTSLVGWFVRDAVDVDLLAQLRGLDRPLLVLVPEKDPLLPPDETAELRAAVEAAGGSLATREPNHDLLAIASRELLPEERAFYEPLLFCERESQALDVWARAAGEHGWRDRPASAFEPGTPLRNRLQSILQRWAVPGPGLPLALALSDASDEECAQLAAWSLWLPPELSGTTDLDVLYALVDLRDPAGRLDATFLGTGVYDFGVRSGGTLTEALDCYRDCQDPAGGVGGGVSSNTLTGDMQVHNPDKWIHSSVAWKRERLVDDDHLSARDADRQTLRLFLRAAGIAERLDASGESLEVWQDGAWRPLPAVAPWPVEDPGAAGKVRGQRSH